MRVLVVGSGLAGLTTAYLLRREDIEVWLIEKVGFSFALRILIRNMNIVHQIGFPFCFSRYSDPVMFIIYSTT